MLDKFTARARKVVLIAREEATRLHHDAVGTEHILLGLIREGEGGAALVLRKFGLSLEMVRRQVEKLVPPGGGMRTVGDIPFTARAKSVIGHAVEESGLLNHNYVGTEHLLLALIREGEGVAARVLTELGADHERAKREVMKALGACACAGGAVAGRGRWGQDTTADDQWFDGVGVDGGMVGLARGIVSVWPGRVVDASWTGRRDHEEARSSRDASLLPSGHASS